MAWAFCHSDLSYLDGTWATEFPLVLGHEAAGYVVELGNPVADSEGATEPGLAVGDPVVVTLVRTCGECRACQRGHDVACTGDFPIASKSPLVAADGDRIPQGLNVGAFAEQVVVHRSQVVRLPDDIDPLVACLLGCGVLTGSGAVTNTARVTAGDSVVVVGCGGVGIGAVQAARIAGADPIVAVDPTPDKREAAQGFGATHVVHHFHVRQPFWRRTLIFRGVRQVLIDNGVPANDLRSFTRNNRRELPTLAMEEAPQTRDHLAAA